MTITLKDLQEDRIVLEKDFETLKNRIVSVEKDLGTMKSNLNAVYGAIQQVDKQIVKITPQTEEKQLLVEKQPSAASEKAADSNMPATKQAALNVATS